MAAVGGDELVATARAGGEPQVAGDLAVGVVPDRGTVGRDLDMPKRRPVRGGMGDPGVGERPAGVEGQMRAVGPVKVEPAVAVGVKRRSLLTALPFASNQVVVPSALIRVRPRASPFSRV